jgi:hypothetical protein
MRAVKKRAVKRSGFVALPPEHAAASRLAHEVARGIIARDRGWSLDGLAMSRRWRFTVGRSRWIANAFVSFHFTGLASARGGRAVYAIRFEGELKASAPVRELAARLAPYRWSHDASLMAMWADSRPRFLLAELDRISAAFGSTDRAESHGYVDRAGKALPELALMKLQALSMRAALAEAAFLEAALAEATSSRGSACRGRP